MKKIFTLAFFYLITMYLSIAQPGSIDNTFNPLGYQGNGPSSDVISSYVQPDGKILFGGNFTDYHGQSRRGLIRLNMDGSLDPVFNQGDGANAYVTSIIMQPDNKIVIGGLFLSYNNNSSYEVARINSDGSYDNTLNIGTGGNNGYVYALALQPNGKILVGGAFLKFNGNLTSKGLARLNSDGSVDTNFGVGTGFNGTVYAIGIQSDGKVLVGGDFTKFNGVTVKQLIRLNSDGTLDATFTNGPNGTVRCIKVLSNDKIMMSGDFTMFGGSIGSVARLNSDGTKDVSFLATNLLYTTYSMSIQSDGKIVVGGSFDVYNVTTKKNLIRLNTDGTHDNTFDVGLKMESRVSTTSIGIDEKIIIGGEFLNYGGTSQRYTASLNTDGSLDESFGKSPYSKAYTSAIQSDGKVLLGGSLRGLDNSPYSLIRLNANGSKDAAFVPGTGANEEIRSIALQTDGASMIGGKFTSYNGSSANRICRLTSTGTLDATFDAGTGANGSVEKIKIQSDGKILFCGNFTLYNGSVCNRLARVGSDGNIDAGFTTGLGANDTIKTMALQTGGKIIIAGNFTSYNGNATNRVARLNSDGTLDNTFSVGTGANKMIHTVAIQSDGKILIGGEFTDYNGNAVNRIARLNSDGSYDASFVVGTGADKVVRDIIVQSDDKIIIGGSFRKYNGIDRARLARLSATGSLDASFIISSGANNNIYALALQADEKLIIAGEFTRYYNSNNFSPQVMRVLTCELSSATSLSGQTITATQAGASYQWLDCNNSNAVISGETNQSFTASTTGSYAVIVSNANCSIKSSCVSVLVNTTEIEALQENKKLKIFPNPTAGKVEFTTDQTVELITVTNSHGQVIMAVVPSSTTLTIIMEEYPDGMYYVMINNLGKNYISKLMLQK